MTHENTEESRQTLYVRGITEEVDEEVLFELFLNAGPVKKVSIPTEPGSKRKKNFCFIQFHHEESVPYAINLFKGIKLFGRSLQMQNRTTGAGMQQQASNHHRTMSAPPMQLNRQVGGFVPPLFQQQPPNYYQPHYQYPQHQQHYGRQNDGFHDRHRSHERQHYNDQRNHHRNDYRDRSHDRRSSSHHHDNRNRRR